MTGILNGLKTTAGVSGGATTADNAAKTNAVSSNATSTNLQSAIPTQSTPITSNSNTLNVADEVATITNQNSLAMRSAAANGKRAASSRGLGNSTLGAEAAQRAMVDAALPMAQQNVSQRHDQTMQEESVRANTVGEYINGYNGLMSGYMNAYEGIQGSDMTTADKNKAIATLEAETKQRLAEMKTAFSSLKTAQADWMDFPDLI